MGENWAFLLALHDMVLSFSNPRPNSAQTHRSNPQIRSKAFQRDSLQQFRVILQQYFVPFGCGSKQQGDKFLFSLQEFCLCKLASPIGDVDVFLEQSCQDTLFQDVKNDVLHAFHGFITGCVADVAFQ